MKTRFLLTVSCAAALLAPALRAETATERDFNLARAERDKAAAAAVEPINRRYKDSLEQLLRRATQGNDLNTALKIKTELGAATAGLATVTPPAKQDDAAAPGAALSDLKLQISGSKWKFTSTSHWVEFRPDGSLRYDAKMGTWESKSKDKVTITVEKDKPLILTLTRDGRHLEKQKGIPFLELREPAK